MFIEGGGAGGSVAAPVAADLIIALDEELEAAASPLASCVEGSWPTFQGTSERTGCGLATGIVEPHIVWGTNVGIQGWLNNPVIVGEMVYTGSAGTLRGQPDPGDGVYALRLDDGGVVWTHPAGNDVNGVAVIDDLVIATADEGWEIGSASCRERG